ncbi:hypothetical protein GGQ97_000160 [Sphingomonas kaistensis]|uniref:Uncharacterized protein n=1 Tax=Sphingomonas kaistensis TaxID=298708 RepID=A0A7X5Y4G8_9SPHN|nr:hypothetical protein [Sphingomonas kaistensis]NJC04367.1 hypothetical protein [Sphingomonas kaistensis]
MRKILPLALFAALASPASAQVNPRPPEPPRYSDPGYAQLPPEIANGGAVDQIGNMVGAVTRALLDLPVGELEAAVENRPVTRQDRQRTVRSVTGTDERDVTAGIEQSKGAVVAGGRAMARTLPVIREALNKAGEEIERATANVPQPGYPRR